MYDLFNEWKIKTYLNLSPLNKPSLSMYKSFFTNAKKHLKRFRSLSLFFTSERQFEWILNLFAAELRELYGKPLSLRIFWMLINEGWQSTPASDNKVFVIAEVVLLSQHIFVMYGSVRICIISTGNLLYLIS